MPIVKVFYLKILLLLYLFGAFVRIERVQGADLSHALNNINNSLLRRRTLAFQDCGSKYDILYLSISSCNSLPCMMKRGTTVTVNVIFDDEGNNTSFLKHTVRWVFNAIKTDALITPDPCDGYHDCIMNSTDGKSYWAVLYVNDTLPVIGGSMIWEAVDEKNEQVICFKVPVAISA